MANNWPKTITVCPDPNCGDWWAEAEGRTLCENYEAHELGDYPTLESIQVIPATVSDEMVKRALKAYENPAKHHDRLRAALEAALLPPDHPSEDD